MRIVKKLCLSLDFKMKEHRWALFPMILGTISLTIGMLWVFGVIERIKFN